MDSSRFDNGQEAKKPFSNAERNVSESNPIRLTRNLSEVSTTPTSLAIPSSSCFCFSHSINPQGNKASFIACDIMFLTENRRQQDCGLIPMGLVLRICIPEAFPILLVYHLPSCTWKFLKGWVGSGGGSYSSLGLILSTVLQNTPSGWHQNLHHGKHCRSRKDEM